MKFHSLRRPPLPQFPATLAAELETVRASLLDLIRAIPCVADRLTNQPAERADSGLEITSGKLLRPALLLLSARICAKSHGHADLSHEAQTRVQNAAVAVEAIHTASLWHDDVLDCSPIRRGKKSVPELVGNRKAVLYGDMLISQALDLIVQLGDISQLAALSQLVKTMSQAQIQEQNQRGDIDISLTEYLDTIRGKTASLLSFCCRLGAEVGHGSQDDSLRLQRFGQNLGLAFQIGDDILDIWGDPDQTGKVALGDWEEQTLTLPVILALHSATPKQRVRLQKLLDLPAAEADRQVACLLTELDILPQALEYARRYALQAEEEVANWPEHPEQCLLRELAKWSGRLEQVATGHFS